MNARELSQIDTNGSYEASLQDLEKVNEFQAELYLHVKLLVNKHFQEVAKMDEKVTINLDNRIWNNSKRFSQDFFEMVGMYQDRG
jgi:hypothetical protein